MININDNIKILTENLEKQIGRKIIFFYSAVNEQSKNSIISVLNQTDKNKKITLFLSTDGGDLTVAWQIINLIKNLFGDYEVIVPDKAISAGTLMCLGASSIIMSNMAYLSPFDQIINFNGYSEDKNIESESISNYIKNVSDICNNNFIEIQKIGHLYRRTEQTKYFANNLLKVHIKDENDLNMTRDILTGHKSLHGHFIYKFEAKNILKLNIKDTDIEIEKNILEIFEKIPKDCYEKNYVYTI